MGDTATGTLAGFPTRRGWHPPHPRTGVRTSRAVLTHCRRDALVGTSTKVVGGVRATVTSATCAVCGHRGSDLADVHRRLGAADEAIGGITRVAPGLFLGGAPGPEDAGRLRDLGVRNILSVAAECHNAWAGYHGGFRLAHVGLHDHVLMPPWLAVLAVRALDGMVRDGPTLVHCGVGISRSPTVLALWWWATGQSPSLAEGVARLRRLRPCVAPNRIVDEAVLAAVGRLRDEWDQIRGRRPSGSRRARCRGPA